MSARATGHSAGLVQVPAPGPGIAPFENRPRQWLARAAAKLGAFGSNRGERHLAFQANGKTIVYAYIRKNACSAFKAMICAESPHRARLKEFADPMKFLGTFHAVRTAKQMPVADHVIFVYRDPIERTVSLFRNKFIVRVNNADTVNHYFEVTGQKPGDATFRDFVTRYLAGDLSQRDPHCRPQYRHLFPVRYSEAIPMELLWSSMRAIVGPELCDRYFKVRVNATDGVETSEPAMDVTADALQLRYAQDGTLPRLSAFLDEELRGRLNQIYAEDVAMIGRLQGSAIPPRDENMGMESRRDARE